MVRTRHSGDHEDESPRKLISLAQEKSKFLTKCGERSHVDDGDLDDYNIFEDKVVESRLRPRTGPRRAYNYLDAESSDDEIQMRIRPLLSQSVNGKLLRSRSSQVKEEIMDEERQTYGQNSKSKRQTIDDADDEDGNISTRRSMRNRRQVYNTLNQSLVNGDKMDKKGRDMRSNNRKDDSNEDLKDQESDEDAKEQETEDNMEFSDMYSRVKRKRVRVKRNMYGMPMNDSDSDTDQDEDNCNNNKRRNNAPDDDDDDDEEDEENEKDESSGVSTRHKSRDRNLRKREPQQTVKSYSLREHKPRTDLYKAPVEEKRHRKIHHGLFDVTPTKKTSGQTYQSPALRRNIKKRSAIHSSSTSTSTSESESNDEKNFKRRKAKSMAKARSRMMPMNFSNSPPASSIIKDRVKSGASLADVEPMNIDKNITFNSIGGLGKHIRALKEMVVFPLLYDKVFQRFKVDPPRGVLFYGPPGTGKTLVARALANECSHGDKRVAFFMRKGADCLSKWVGESERQLRLLFDQAYKFRPSIIFFDEIDGLAPVRSSRQDQIHSSIVSTLLALMDGLDSRGEIVVIGATNRIDSLDPALRRPGRFDREFLFPLPSLEARKQILKIQTSSWNPLLNDAFIEELAEKCVGYCGADLKALCTEAAMLALRRRYPQIYISNEALQLDESSINVSAKDFFDAIGNIIPTSQRACDTPARALSMQVRPLLERQLNKILDQLSDTFPLCLSKMSSLDAAATSSQIKALAEAGTVWDDLASDEDEDAPSIFVSPHGKGSKSKGHSTSEGGPSTSFSSPNTYLNFTSFATSRPATFRPRLLLTGRPGQGQTTYLAPAVIHKMEDLPVHVLDLPTLYAVTAKTPEESCSNVFHEAKRKSPSIIYLPYINQWWDVMGETLRATLLTLIHDLNPSMPLLLLATSEQSYKELDPMLQSLFNQFSGEVITMANPNAEERRKYFKDLLLRQSCKPPPQKKQAAKRMLEVLPKAAPIKPRELTDEEMKQLVEKEELTLMELRIFLRDVLNKLGSDKKFSIFAKPVNIEDAPDYLEIIESPMDLSTMMSKIDLHEYTTVHSFIDDIDLICSNALEYNPNRGPMDRIIRHRACALKDTAYAIIKTELDKDFEKLCLEIEESRRRRGVKSASVPKYYHTKPASRNNEGTSKSQSTLPSYLQENRPPRSIPKPEGERFSRRVRGLNIDPVLPLEDVEKTGRLARANNSPVQDGNNSPSKSNSKETESPVQEAVKADKSDGSVQKNDVKSKFPMLASKQCDSDVNKSNSSNSKSLSRKKTTKCIWCKPRRKRRRLIFSSSSATKTSGEEDLEEEMSQENEETEAEHSYNQVLRVDVSDNLTETDESKGATRKSPRGLGSPLGVVTRRQSLSPHTTLPNTKKAPDKEIDDFSKDQQIPNDIPEVSQEIQSQETSLLPKESSTTDMCGPNSHLIALNKKLRDSLMHSSLPNKTSVVKRLDLDSAIVDSGAGSSLDSNGDSRDSTDHKLERNSTPKINSETADISNNCNLLLSKQASNVLSEHSQKLEVPVEKLTSLLDHLVHRTEEFNVERLQKIYSCLSQVIYRHRHSYNRTSMVLEMERRVDEMTVFRERTSSVHNALF